MKKSLYPFIPITEFGLPFEFVDKPILSGNEYKLKESVTIDRVYGEFSNEDVIFFNKEMPLIQLEIATDSTSKELSITPVGYLSTEMNILTAKGIRQAAHSPNGEYISIPVSRIIYKEVGSEELFRLHIGCNWPF